MIFFDKDIPMIEIAEAITSIGCEMKNDGEGNIVVRRRLDDSGEEKPASRGARRVFGDPDHFERLMYNGMTRDEYLDDPRRQEPTG